MQNQEVAGSEVKHPVRPKFSLNKRIIGGRVVEQMIPFQVSLQAPKYNGHFCGGAIISKWHVLTAAHCFRSIAPENATVVVGTLYRNMGGDRHEVVGSDIHRKHLGSPKSIYDLAVLRVKPAFNFTKPEIKAIPLSLTPVGPNEAVSVSGWGSVNANVEVLPEKLQFLVQLTISNELCEKYESAVINKHHLCANSPRSQGTCAGDSGAPLVRRTGDRTELVGILSKGINACASGRPDVYTRVYTLLPYIRKAMTKTIE